jgi:hypothetical protein
MSISSYFANDKYFLSAISASLLVALQFEVEISGEALETD